MLLDIMPREQMESLNEEATHDFWQDLPKNLDELIVYKLATLKTGLFEAFNLLLHNGLKGTRVHEQTRGGALNSLSTVSKNGMWFKWRSRGSKHTDELYRRTRMSPSLI